MERCMSMIGVAGHDSQGWYSSGREIFLYTPKATRYLPQRWLCYTLTTAIDALTPNACMRFPMLLYSCRLEAAIIMQSWRCLFSSWRYSLASLHYNTLKCRIVHMQLNTIRISRFVSSAMADTICSVTLQLAWQVPRIK